VNPETSSYHKKSASIGSSPLSPKTFFIPPFPQNNSLNNSPFQPKENPFASNPLLKKLIQNQQMQLSRRSDKSENATDSHRMKFGKVAQTKQDFMWEPAEPSTSPLKHRGTARSKKSNFNKEAPEKVDRKSSNMSMSSLKPQSKSCVMM
jgi:hypothetical protein